MWYTEAGKYNVFPIDGSAIPRLMAERPQVAEPRTQYVYRPGTQSLPYFVGPKVVNRPHAITADTEIPAGGAEGVLLCQGSNVGGWSFYVKDGRLCYAHNYVARTTYQCPRPDPLPAGRHQLRFEFEPTGKPDIAQGKGSPAGRSCTSTASSLPRRSSRSPRPSPSTPAGSPAAPTPAPRSPPDYRAPFPFTGTLHTVTVDLSGDLITDTEAKCAWPWPASKPARTILLSARQRLMLTLLQHAAAGERQPPAPGRRAAITLPGHGRARSTQ